MKKFEANFSPEIDKLITKLTYENVKFDLSMGSQITLQDLTANAKASELGKQTIKNQINNLTAKKKKLEESGSVDPFAVDSNSNQNEFFIKEIDDKLKVLFAIAKMIVEEESFKKDLEKSKKEKDQKLAELKAKKEMMEVNKLGKLGVDDLQKEIENLDKMMQELENN